MSTEASVIVNENAGARVAPARDAMRLSRRQREALRAVIDALIPSVESENGGPADFWRRKATDLDVDRHIVETLALLPRAAQSSFWWLLMLLASPLSGLLAGGWPRAFARLASGERERMLRRWSSSRFALLRMAFASLKRISCFVYYGCSSGGDNPNWAAIGYPPPPRPAMGCAPAAALRLTEPADVIDCDTLVIGSGAGGGVVAATLAEHGRDVVIAEKGAYVPPVERSNLEFDMVSRLFEGGGMQATDDQAISLFAGNGLGGGTTINWSVSLRPGEALLREWALRHGLPHLLTRDFARCVDIVCQRIGVVDQVPHNAQNLALLDGARRLGFASGPLPQNVRGCERHGHDHCGYCTFGCRYGYKQDVTEAFLRGAQTGGSVRIHARTEVKRLHFRMGSATHADALVRSPDGSSRNVTIRAGRYVLAAGAIRTPVLLLASGFRHPHLGRHLYLHPAILVIGEYPRAMESWRGAMMTSYCDAAANLDDDNYGCKIETAPLHPGLLAAVLPWRGGSQHKRAMLAARRYAGLAVITRDRHGGRVSVDREGRPRVHYRFHPSDRQHALQGMAAATAIHAAAGADRVLATHHEGLSFDARTEPVSTAGYRAAIEAMDWGPNRVPMFSAHLMGTCRMGDRSVESPVTPDGRLVGIRNVYVADGSVFPSASGINPMVTIQSLALHTALGIVAGPRREGR